MHDHSTEEATDADQAWRSVTITMARDGELHIHAHWGGSVEDLSDVLIQAARMVLGEEDEATLDEKAVDDFIKLLNNLEP